MLSHPRLRPFRSLSLRLSLNYAACSLLSMVAVLIICYLFLQGSLRRRMDVDLYQELPEYRALLESQDLDVLQDALREEVGSEGVDQVFFRLADAEGNILFSTDTASWSLLRMDQGAVHSTLSLEGKPVFMDYHEADRNFSARIVYGAIGDNLVLQIGESLEANQTLLRQFRKVFTIATMAFVFCSLLAGAYMAQRALSGVQRVTQAAVYITAGAWEHRVPVSGYDDEIDGLANAFNTMVERIQVLFRELRDVTDDIAHDLRTPLMRIRGEAEMALRTGGETSLDQNHCGSVLEECDRMLHLINTMLEISQTEAGVQALESSPIQLGDLLEDVCDLFRPAAEDKGLNLSLTLRDNVLVQGESPRIKRALAHLIDNAIKYTPDGGTLTVSCVPTEQGTTVIIQDSGIGIPAESLDNVFNRFYRVESSRSAPGNGLGLSLARAIIRAHGGDITVSSQLGTGTEFQVRLPRLDSATTS